MKIKTILRKTKKYTPIVLLKSNLEYLDGNNKEIINHYFVTLSEISDKVVEKINCTDLLPGDKFISYNTRDYRFSLFYGGLCKFYFKNNVYNFNSIIFLECIDNDTQEKVLLVNNSTFLPFKTSLNRCIRRMGYNKKSTIFLESNDFDSFFIPFNLPLQINFPELQKEICEELLKNKEDLHLKIIQSIRDSGIPIEETVKEVVEESTVEIQEPQEEVIQESVHS